MKVIVSVECEAEEIPNIIKALAELGGVSRPMGKGGLR
jgi:hypothetical protein